MNRRKPWKIANNMRNVASRRRKFKGHPGERYWIKHVLGWVDELKAALVEEDKENFYLGFLCALAPLEVFQQDSIFDEVVNVADPDELIAVARKHGQMRISGMSRWLKRNRGPEA